MTTIKRPAWAQKTPSMQAYYDSEWGIACHDDRMLFELLTLESFQIGLSWQIVLNKRRALRARFADFNPAIVAQMTADDVTRLLNDATIIRNRRKIEATIHNAQVIRALRQGGQTFDDYVWQLVDYQVQRVQLGENEKLPPKTKTSEAAAKRFKQDGFQLVGPVTLYSFMQAAGLVNARLS